MSKKGIFYLAFFVLLFTAFVYAVVGEYDLSGTKLAVINKDVGTFNFTDQNGKAFTRTNVEEKVYVAEYFFTTCAGICPKMNANMRRVWDKYKDEKRFLILSHTCMPEKDSVPVLKQYEIKMLQSKPVQKADGSFVLVVDSTSAVPANKNWIFLTGDKQALYAMARRGYLIDDGKPDSTQLIKDQFIHTQFFSLVDKQGRVRAIYDGLKEDEVQQMMKDIDGLLKEKITSKRFMNGFSNNPG